MPSLCKYLRYTSNSVKNQPFATHHMGWYSTPWILPTSGKEAAIRWETHIRTTITVLIHLSAMLSISNFVFRKKEKVSHWIHILNLKVSYQNHLTWMAGTRTTRRLYSSLQPGQPGLSRSTWYRYNKLIKHLNFKNILMKHLNLNLNLPPTRATGA